MVVRVKYETNDPVQLRQRIQELEALASQYLQEREWADRRIQELEATTDALAMRAAEQTRRAVKAEAALREIEASSWDDSGETQDIARRALEGER